jgi:hypothetical protein
LRDCAPRLGEIQPHRMIGDTVAEESTPSPVP